MGVNGIMRYTYNKQCQNKVTLEKLYINKLTFFLDLAVVGISTSGFQKEIV